MVVLQPPTGFNLEYSGEIQRANQPNRIVIRASRIKRFIHYPHLHACTDILYSNEKMSCIGPIGRNTTYILSTISRS